MGTAIQFSDQELRLLVTHLQRRVDQLDRELVRTDNPPMQHELAREAEELRALLSRVAQAGEAASLGAYAR